MGGLREIVVAVYAAGAELRAEGGKLGVKNPGLLDPEALRGVKAHKEELVEMLTGDPLQGPGWEGRAALWCQAMNRLDLMLSGTSPDGTDKSRVAAAATDPEASERLNAAWTEGTFEEFRQALKEYARTAPGAPTKGA